ncbi:MAG: CBS domain-containing protein [Candidatus Omnitrophica bacterium]|nr:CBS domain-containing protein [Candidatus Omnitrophota bacterium]
MAYVRDVMEKEIVTGKSSDSIQKISKVLTEKKMSNIPIMGEQDELVGIVSEQDILRAMESENFINKIANDIMTKKVLSVKENDSLEYVSKIFTEYPYRRLPVTRNKKVVGSITREDIISSFMSDYY